MQEYMSSDSSHKKTFITISMTLPKSPTQSPGQSPNPVTCGFTSHPPTAFQKMRQHGTVANCKKCHMEPFVFFTWMNGSNLAQVTQREESQSWHLLPPNWVWQKTWINLFLWIKIGSNCWKVLEQTNLNWGKLFCLDQTWIKEFKTLWCQLSLLDQKWTTLRKEKIKKNKNKLKSS